jgi:hypothetical protein
MVVVHGCVEGVHPDDMDGINPSETENTDMDGVRTDFSFSVVRYVGKLSRSHSHYLC